MKSHATIVVAFTSLALTLAACGGGSAPTAASSPAPGSSAGAPAASRSTAASSPASSKPAVPASAPASSSPASAAAGAGLIPLTVSYSAVIGINYPEWVAQDAGIFKKNGLNVDLRYIASSKGIAALVAGDVQVADAGGSETLSAAVGGAKLTTIAIDGPVYPFVLMAPANIKTVNDLKGKKVGVSEYGSTSDIATRVALEKEGLNPDKDVTVLAVGSASNRIAAMQSGAIQAGLSFPPNTVKLEQLGFHTLVDLAQLNLPAVVSTSSVETSYLSAHRDAMQKYVDSLVEAIAWAKSNKTATIKIMEKYYKNNNDKVIATAYDYFVGKGVVPALPYPKAELYRDAAAQLAKKNAAVKGYDMSKMLDSSFVKSAADRHLDRAMASASASH
ncbi:MAG: ABC transporter substrate-binding protein [Chloroflexota bacterium]|nr:ABC transporter substrate-binding protein [Chloroflexota bacterium]